MTRAGCSKGPPVALLDIGVSSGASGFGDSEADAGLVSEAEV